MAQIKSEQLVVEFSKLFKNDSPQQHILSEDQLATLTVVIEATIAELIADPAVVVEVSRLGE